MNAAKLAYEQRLRLVELNGRLRGEHEVLMTAARNLCKEAAMVELGRSRKAGGGPAKGASAPILENSESRTQSISDQ